MSISMAVPTIALMASPPSTVVSTSNPFQINAHGSHDFDFSSRSSPSTASTSKPIAGGLSCLFSSHAVARHASPSSSSASCSSGFAGGSEELGSLWHDRGEELKEFGGSFRYSPPVKFSGFTALSSRDQSPVSVFHGPGSGSPPARIARDGLFNRFVRGGAVVGSSCVDYDVGKDDLDLNLTGLVEELTFNIEDGFSEPYAKDFLLRAQLRHEIFRDEFVVKAFYEAEKAHRGQMRASGDPYLQHCVETAVSLAMIGANATVVAAGLLHDTLDDSFMSHDYIRETFGAGVADLVGGVSKLSQLSKLARENDTACKTVEADRLHTMFLAMADARAVLVKLADRLHNMMTLEALPLDKQKRFAKETLEIFVPLANRLGVSTWKEQLENLCFKHLNPDQHEELSSKLLDSFDEATIASAIKKLEKALRKEGISYHVLSGRHKSVSSIYNKMLKKKLNMDEIHDINGLRLIVEKEEDCYRALEVIHKIWSEVPGKSKDYITNPKFNGYQSIHTVVMGESSVPLEVQIRTKDMHLQAEFGFAAHWRYKEGDSKHSSFVLQMVEWARWVVTWQCQIGHSDSVKPPCTFPHHSPDCPYSYQPYCANDGPVFIIMIENDKMSVQEFPANSTITNVMESSGRGSSRWAPYGFPLKEELRPRVNHETVSDPMRKLKMGDIVNLTPAIPDKSLTEYREEIQRMYNRGLTVSSPSRI